MGGYNSGGHNRKLVTVEASVKLDAAMLRRAGLLGVALSQPKGRSWDYSSNRDRHTCTVAVVAGHLASPDPRSEGLGTRTEDRGGAVEVIIITPDRVEHRQRIRTSASACNYGRERHWLHCPHCGRRAFKLYYYPHTYCNGVQVHRFTCRHCLRPTYQARRERGFALYQSRCFNAHDRMKEWARVHGVTGYKADRWQWQMPPDKPAGMRWRTYDRIARRWERDVELAEDAFAAGLTALMERSEKLLKR